MPGILPLGQHPHFGIDKTLTLVSFQHNVMFPAGHVSGSQCLRYDPGVQP